MVRLLFISAFGSLVLCSCSGWKHQQKGPEKKTVVQASGLKGAWELEYLLDPVDMTVLYPGKKPELIISDIAGGMFQGSSGCNRIGGRLVAGDRKIHFEDPVALTRMTCPGAGETAFLTALKRVNAYGLSAENKKLTCIRGDIIIMRFRRK